MSNLNTSKPVSSSAGKVVVKEFWCPQRRRNVSATFEVKGWWIFRKLKAVVDCPAMNDAGPTCVKSCLCADERHWATRDVGRTLEGLSPGL